jgi:hypothetical protein
MTIQNEESQEVRDSESTINRSNQVMVAAGESSSFDRITGDMVADVNDNFQEALQMHAKLNESYLGYRCSIRFPSSCEATIQPEMFPEAMQEKYRNEKLRLGKMDTMPSWIKKIGTSLRGAVTSRLSSYSSNTDARFGYMVKLEHFETVETELLAIKGVSDEDHETFAHTDIVSKATEMIETRRSKLDAWHAERNAPVTYLEYIAYLQENYSALRAEILNSYQQDFESDVVDVIGSLIPSRESFFNRKRIRFDWRRTQEVPSCVMQGNTTYRQVADRVQAQEDMQHQLEGIRQREIESWKQQTLDSVTDIQVGLRNMIADKISQLKTRLDRTPMTEAELEAERENGKQRVTDPSRITQASINKLVAHIDELTEELGQFESTDQFYQAVSELRRSLGFEDNFDDAATRQQLSQNIEHIVNLSIDDTTINPKTGDFFVSLM